MFKHKRANNGQSTVEYIVLATAVIAVVILFVVNPNTKDGFQQRLNGMIGTAANRMEKKGQTLQSSHKSEASTTAVLIPDAVSVNPDKGFKLLF